MYEEYMDLPNFDPVRFANDPSYAELVKQARLIKDNEDALKKAGQTIEQKDAAIAARSTPKESPKITVVDGNANAELVPKSEFKPTIIDEAKPSNVVTENITKNVNDFKMTDFIEQEKYNANSPIYKKLNSEQKQTGVSIPIESIWIDKGQVKKYLASKNVFKIKEKGENRYRVYRYTAVGDEEIEQLRLMGEDLRSFYQLMALEGNMIEDDNENKTLALHRNGKDYLQPSKLESDYDRKLAQLVLGISKEDFRELEMFSDPDFTVLDIWGLKDVLNSIIERAVSGASYFLIASKV
jgi:hypothetical protein